MIGFGDARWLLALVPAVLFVVWTGREGRRAVSRSQHRIAIVARSLAMGLLMVALAQPSVALPDDSRSVLFLVDRSDSITAPAVAAQEAFLDAALAETSAHDFAAVAVFGANVKVDASLAAAAEHRSIRAVVDGSRTDLSGALASAAALLPTSGSRRIVLLTDLVPTTGDPNPAIQALAERGIVVDVVSFETGRGPDALIESVRTPSVARVGEEATSTVVIRTNQDGPAVVEVVTNGEVQRLEVDLVSGVNEIEVTSAVTEPGFLNVVATVDTAFDTQTANNRAQGVTRVVGPATVAVVEGKAGEADQLISALEATGMLVDKVPALPGDTELLAFDAVVLVNVAAPGPAEVERLRSYVEDLGRGLLVVGGDRSYGLGGYQDSAIEDILPVRSNPEDLLRRQPIAEVLVIDTSGSMGRCHCNDGAFAEGGVNKTDISRAGAALAIDALTSQDRVGVLAFGAGTEWVIPLGEKPPSSDVDAALGTLTPDGATTAIARGLEEAAAALNGVSESIRHIVLFTDGWDPNEATLIPAAREIAESGITLSVLATGEGPGISLQRMAELGGGRYYPGHDLEAIPEVFVEETLQVAEGIAQEGTFFAALGTPSRVTEDLVEAPSLGGYVLAKAKPTSTVPLRIGEADPLLASWQRGLGRVTAWTSDATARWSSQWIVWEGYVSFWGTVVTDILPPGRDTPPAVEVRSGDLLITYPAPDSPDAVATATVRLPSGDINTVPLSRSADGLFGGGIRAGVLGTYWVSVTVEDGDGVLASGSSGAVSAYSDEFSFRDPDPLLGQSMVEASGGRLDPSPDTVFDRAATVGSADVGIWAWLVGAAMILFLIDVTLRRLVLFGRQPVGSVRTEGDVGGPSRVEYVDDPDPEPEGPATETLGRLLDRRRR